MVFRKIRGRIVPIKSYSEIADQTKRISYKAYHMSQIDKFVGRTSRGRTNARRFDKHWAIHKKFVAKDKAVKRRFRLAAAGLGAVGVGYAIGKAGE